MNIRPCPPGDVFHYHAATALIQRSHLLSNQWPCSTAAEHARQRPSANGPNRWQPDRTLKPQVMKSSFLHICRKTGINGKADSEPSRCASYLRVSVVVFVSVAALLRDPLSAQPSSPLWPCICGADQRRLWRRRDQGSESPPSEQPRLVHFPVSPTLRGHSSQPISNRRVRERAFRERGGA